MRHLIASIAGATAMAAALGLAPTPVIVRDRFTDNSINQQLWIERGFGVIGMNETNQRLEFNAAVNSNQDGYAGLEVRNWGANWKYDFEIEVDCKVSLGNVSGDREVILVLGLTAEGEFPDTPTGFIAALARDDVGLVLFIARVENGEIIEGDEQDIAVTQGELNLEWDRSDGRFTATFGPAQVALNGAWAALGGEFGNVPLVISIGCFTLEGNRTFPGTRVWMDEFKFDGVKKARL